MNTDGAATWYSLHLHLEALNVFVTKNEIDNTCGVGPASVGIIGKIALQTSRVVTQAVAVAYSRTIGKAQSNRAKVDRHVLERPRLDATTTSAGWNRNLR